MTFETLQAFQSDMEKAIRTLSAQQLALVQQFGEAQRDVLSTPSAWTTPETYTQIQGLLGKFVQANQEFVTASVSDTQTYWTSHLSEGQSAFANAQTVIQEAKRTVEAAFTPPKATSKKSSK